MQDPWQQGLGPSFSPCTPTAQHGAGHMVFAQCLSIEWMMSKFIGTYMDNIEFSYINRTGYYQIAHKPYCIYIVYPTNVPPVNVTCEWVGDCMWGKRWTWPWREEVETWRYWIWLWRSLGRVCLPWRIFNKPENVSSIKILSLIPVSHSQYDFSWENRNVHPHSWLPHACHKNWGGQAGEKLPWKGV